MTQKEATFDSWGSAETVVPAPDRETLATLPLGWESRERGTQGCLRGQVQFRRCCKASNPGPCQAMQGPPVICCQRLGDRIPALEAQPSAGLAQRRSPWLPRQPGQPVWAQHCRWGHWAATATRLSGACPASAAEPGSAVPLDPCVPAGGWPSWGSAAAGVQSHGDSGLEMHCRQLPDPRWKALSCLLQIGKLRP